MWSSNGDGSSPEKEGIVLLPGSWSPTTALNARGTEQSAQPGTWPQGIDVNKEGQALSVHLN